MILVDTSVWIDLFSRSPRHRLAPEQLVTVTTCPPVIQEVLQGIKDDGIHARLKERFLALPRIGEPVQLDTWISAADLFRAARRRGISVRSGVDCLIAAIAIRSKAAVWHHDRDFEQLARFSDLRTHRGPEFPD